MRCRDAIGDAYGQGQLTYVLGEVGYCDALTEAEVSRLTRALCDARFVVSMNYPVSVTSDSPRFRLAVWLAAWVASHYDGVIWRPGYGIVEPSTERLLVLTA